MKVALLSNHFSGAVKLRYLLRHGFPIHTVVTLDAARAEEYRVSGYEDFSTFAGQVPNIYTCRDFSLKSTEDTAFFKQEKFDFLLIGGWQRLIPSDIFETLQVCAIAEHGSAEELPKGRGRSPINWSIIDGKSRFIVHLFRADAGADSGPVFAKQAVAINSHDSVESMYYKTGIVTAQLTVDCLPKIMDGSLVGVPQSESGATYFRKRGEAADFISWSLRTQEIHDHIRASTRPYPGAKSWLNGRKIMFWSAQPFDLAISYPGVLVGEVAEIFTDSRFLVKTGDGLLLINQAQAEDGRNWRVKVGDRFG